MALGGLLTQIKRKKIPLRMILPIALPIFASSFFLNRFFSRINEYEADKYIARIPQTIEEKRKAVRHAIKFFEDPYAACPDHFVVPTKIKKPGFLSRLASPHPTETNRIKRLKKELNKYESAEKS